MSEHAAESGHDEGASHASSGHGGGGHGAGGGGHEEGHEGAPEWLISFADNVALMMGFFVILLAMNMGPKASSVQGGEKDETNANTGAGHMDALDFIISIREGFHNKIDLSSKDPREEALRNRIKQRQGGPADRDSVAGRAPLVQGARKGESRRATAVVHFEDRSALLSAADRQTLADAARRLKGERYIIEIRGHTSPFEAMRQEFKARDLSYDRAKAAAQVLTENGVPWELLRVVAAGTSDRVVARTFDPAEDRANQRVEIVVSEELAPPDPYANPASGGTASADDK